MEIIKSTAPSIWACYLINGGASGLSDSEVEQCDEWVFSLGCGSPISAEDAGFVKYPDSGSQATDCQEYTFLRSHK